MNFLQGWTVKNENTLTYGNLTLKTLNGKAKQFQGRESTVTIRPEDIRVLDEESSGENILFTEVEKIEFRGSSYRLFLRLTTEDRDLEAPVIEADLAAEKIKRFNIRIDSRLPVYFPPERLLIFKQTGS
jgi:ABC-type sugar transport system ATPase subunit